MDEDRRKLLDEHGVIILPYIIDHDTYVMMNEAMLTTGGRPIFLHCRGDGGSAREVSSIAGLIQHHGNVTGLLTGNAYSSHGTTFAVCQKRYIYPDATLSVHMVALAEISSRSDAVSLRHKLADFEQLDRYNARILAAASNKSAEFWHDLISTVSDEAVIISYEQMIEYELARPVSEMMVELGKMNGGQAEKVPVTV